MKIINLIENTIGRNEKCFYEHGLSFYIETNKHKILVDTGASDKFTYNADLLDVNLKDVDICVLSHGHYDHAGGILKFSEINSEATIYMNSLAGGEFYHIYEQEEVDVSAREKYIGIDKKILELRTLEHVNGNKKIDEELFLFGGVKGRRLWPKGNEVLKVKKDNEFYQDEFEHEQYLVIHSDSKKILVSGCAHNGVLNILDRYNELLGDYPDYVISGFHMLNKAGYSNEDIEMIKKTANELMKYDIKFFTGHCTGETPFNIMKEIMGEQICYIHSGDEIVI